jgi:hypothetical protein
VNVRSPAALEERKTSTAFGERYVEPPGGARTVVMNIINCDMSLVGPGAMVYLQCSVLTPQPAHFA